MTDIPQSPFNKDTIRSFAVVVGGDVAFAIKMPAEAENAVAALSSAPQIIEVPNDIKDQVKSGWTFDGQNFIPPTE